jgi:chlorophyllide a reductase subunit X
MDFFGDVVCGGFVTPLGALYSLQHVIIAVGRDRQSLYAADSIAKAASVLRLKSVVRHQFSGLVINRDDGSDCRCHVCPCCRIALFLARSPLSRKDGTISRCV